MSGVAAAGDAEPRALLEASFRHALEATDPGRLVREQLPAERPALVLAVGKAALPMVAEARRAYHDVPWLATPPAAGSRPGNSTEQVMPGSHPLPDTRSVAAAERALALAGTLAPNDLMLVLVSGGGSALWAAPWGDGSGSGEVGLEEKRAVTLALQRAGADIHELNAVRRHLSRIKGGRLAGATAARVLTLALSDVPGDALEDIASGPTVPDPTTFADALAAVRRYGVGLRAVERHLMLGEAGRVPETPKPGAAGSERWEAAVIGSAAKLLQAAAEFWAERGYQAVVLSDRLQGEAGALAAAHAELVAGLLEGRVPAAAVDALVEGAEQASAVSRRLTTWLASDESGPLVLLSGGEATVTVRGGGKGGRNLEFAGWLLHHLRSGRFEPAVSPARGAQRGANSPTNSLTSSPTSGLLGLGVWALSAGSDGVDGSSPAAGAFLAPDSGSRATALPRELGDYLQDNDTDALFHDLGDRLITGPTGHNLNDYRAVIVPRRSR